MSAKRYHGLDGKTHARLRSPYGLVLGIMRYVGRAVEELIDAVATVRLDDATASGFGMLFDDRPGIAEEHAGFDESDGVFETLPGRFHDADGLGISSGAVPHVVCFVKVAVVALMIQRDVDVENVAVKENPLIWNAVAYDLVRGGADRLWEVNVVQRRGIRL